MNALKKYFKHRKNAITEILKKISSSYTSRNFHQLRVEIKKIDALFELINYCSKKFHRKENFSPYKIVFRQAGKVRELHMVNTMLKKYLHSDPLSGYSNYLKNILSKERKIFFSITNNKLTEQLNKSYDDVTPLLKKVNTKKGKHYIEKQEKKLQKMLVEKEVATNQLHNLRKLLKKIGYTRQLLKFPKQQSPNIKKNILPGLLGKWHDSQITTGYLKKANHYSAINQEEKNLLKKTIAILAANNTMLLKRIKLTTATSAM